MMAKQTVPTRTVYCPARCPSDASKPWRSTKYNAKGYLVTKYFTTEKAALKWLTHDNIQN